MNIDLNELSARKSEQVEWKENGDDQEETTSISVHHKNNYKAN